MIVLINDETHLSEWCNPSHQTLALVLTPTLSRKLFYIG